MVIYYIPILILLIATLRKKYLGNLEEKILVISLMIFLCTTYFNGSDWRSYELMYNNLSHYDLRTFSREKGFYIYMFFFRSLGFDFWTFFILTKISCFYVFYLKLKEYTSDIYFTLFLLYGYIFLYFFIDCPLRNLIAISIFLMGEKYLRSGERLKYICYIILAYSFHNTSIVMIFPLIFNNIYKLNKQVLLLILGVCFIIFLNPEILLKISEYLPLKYQHKILGRIESDGLKSSFFSLGSMEKIFLTFMIVCMKQKLLKKTRKNKIIIVMCCIYFIFYRIALTFPFLGRLNQYFIVFYIMGIVEVISLLKRDIRNVVLILLSCYVLILIYQNIHQNYKYLPYTSYLKYIFREKPSFMYRDNYNFIKLIENAKKTGEVIDINKLKLEKERLKRNAGY